MPTSLAPSPSPPPSHPPSSKYTPLHITLTTPLTPAHPTYLPTRHPLSSGEAPPIYRAALASKRQASPSNKQPARPNRPQSAGLRARTVDTEWVELSLSNANITGRVGSIKAV